MTRHSLVRRSSFGLLETALLSLVLSGCASANLEDDGGDNANLSAFPSQGNGAQQPAPANPATNAPPATNTASPSPNPSQNEAPPAAVPVAPAPTPPVTSGNNQPPQPQPQPQQPPQLANCPQWPAATGNRNVSTTMNISGTFDGQLARFTGTGALGNGTQEEGQDALFELAPGATLRNVILGNPSADGVHCQGACTLENVWWEDVGEDAATFRGNSNNQQMTIRCGGARSAADKVFQHNGAGTLTIQDFVVEDFGKLYRSCGNCGTQFARHVVFRDIIASGGGVLAGVNSNLGDTADFEQITLIGAVTVCDRYNGNDTGAEPTKAGSGADGRSCIFTAADITQR